MSQVLRSLFAPFSQGKFRTKIAVQSGTSFLFSASLFLLFPIDWFISGGKVHLESQLNSSSLSVSLSLIPTLFPVDLSSISMGTLNCKKIENTVIILFY